MNRYKFSALLIALFLLNACSGNATKDGTDEVLVEERNGASTSGVAGEGTDGSDLGAEASVIVGVDLNSERKQIAEKFGMTDFVNPKDYPDNKLQEKIKKQI